MKYKRICKRCGDAFETNHSRQLYCLQLKEKICPYCGTKFMQKCGSNPKNYCGSEECLYKSRIQPPKSKIACSICGNTFVPKHHHQTVCGQIHKNRCKICGKEFDYKCEVNSDPDVCYDCRNSYYVKICKYCGKEFYTNVFQEEICHNKHYRTCEICGKEFEVPRNRLFDNTLTCCSKECSNVKRNKSIKNSLSKLNVGWNKPTQEFHKICEWCGEEFITDQPNKIYCDREHYKTCQVCGNLFKVKNKYLGSATLSNYCSVECRQKAKEQTCLDKYGVSNYACTQEFKDNLKFKKGQIEHRRKETMLSKYGTTDISQTDEWVLGLMSDPAKLNNYRNFKENPIEFIESHFNTSPTVSMLSSELGINQSSVCSWVHKLDIKDFVNMQYSSMEVGVDNFISSICDTVIEHNCRHIIPNYEIDIYLPEYQLGIECNPTSTHNSSRNNWNKELPGVPTNYHMNKSKAAKDANLFLFHLFGYEWVHKREIMQSIIANLLHCNTNTLYARKTRIKEVSYKDAKSFLMLNHRQGNCNASVRLGLYYNSELVSIMTFGKVRNSIGKNIENGWELLRFCSKLNTTVVGGASKLFKYFIDQYQPTYIRSYSDVAHTQGKLYETLGFKYVHLSGPGYVWVDEKSDVAYHRINAQKQNIKSFLKDDSIDLENYNERKIMEEHGFVRVFDAGTVLWEYVS